MLEFAIPAILLLSGAPTAAGAEPPSTARVAYRDLDLGTSDGLATLDERLSRAIERVCPDDHDINLWRGRIVRDCRREARIGADASRARIVTRAAAARGQSQKGD